MQDRANSAGWGELKPCTKREFSAELMKEFKCNPELESRGKFIREEVMLHRKSMVSSQRQSERA